MGDKNSKGNGMRWDSSSRCGADSLKDIKLLKILSWTGKQIISKVLESITTVFSALLALYVHLPLPYSNGKNHKVLDLYLSGCKQIN